MVLSASILLISGLADIDVIQSITPLTERGVFLSGVHLKPELKNNSYSIKTGSGIAFCTRFNFRRLISFGKSVVLTVATNDWQLLSFGIGYRYSFVSFGNRDETGSAPSWLVGLSGLSDSIEYSIWTTNRWISVCIAFNISRNVINVVKVNAIAIFFQKISFVKGRVT